MRAGQRVRRGSVLGRLGNPGISVGPHLHFHVEMGPRSAAAKVFSRYLLLGYGRPDAEQGPPERETSVPPEGAVLSLSVA